MARRSLPSSGEWPRFQSVRSPAWRARERPLADSGDVVFVPSNGISLARLLHFNHSQVLSLQSRIFTRAHVRVYVFLCCLLSFPFAYLDERVEASARRCGVFTHTRVRNRTWRTHVAIHARYDDAYIDACCMHISPDRYTEMEFLRGTWWRYGRVSRCGWSICIICRKAFEMTDSDNWFITITYKNSLQNSFLRKCSKRLSIYQKCLQDTFAILFAHKSFSNFKVSHELKTLHNSSYPIP